MTKTLTLEQLIYLAKKPRRIDPKLEQKLNEAEKFMFYFNLKSGPNRLLYDNIYQVYKEFSYEALNREEFKKLILPLVQRNKVINNRLYLWFNVTLASMRYQLKSDGTYAEKDKT